MAPAYRSRHLIDPLQLIARNECQSKPAEIKRKLRREFRRKGYRIVYLEVSGYKLAHEWLREQERASDRRKRWTFALIIVLARIAAVVAAYLAAVQLKWL